MVKTLQTIFLICSLNLAFTRLFAAIIPPFFIICIHFCVNYDLYDFCWKVLLYTKVKWTANNFQIECGAGRQREPRVKAVSELSFIARSGSEAPECSHQMHKKFPNKILIDDTRWKFYCTCTGPVISVGPRRNILKTLMASIKWRQWRNPDVVRVLKSWKQHRSRTRSYWLIKVRTLSEETRWDSRIDQKLISCQVKGYERKCFLLLCFHWLMWFVSRSLGYKVKEVIYTESGASDAKLMNVWFTMGRRQ